MNHSGLDTQAFLPWTTDTETAISLASSREVLVSRIEFVVFLLTIMACLNEHSESTADPSIDFEVTAYVPVAISDPNLSCP